MSYFSEYCKRPTKYQKIVIFSYWKGKKKTFTIFNIQFDHHRRLFFTDFGRWEWWSKKSFFNTLIKTTKPGFLLEKIAFAVPGFFDNLRAWAQPISAMSLPEPDLFPGFSLELEEDEEEEEEPDNSSLKSSHNTSIFSSLSSSLLSFAGDKRHKGGESMEQEWESVMTGKVNSSVPVMVVASIQEEEDLIFYVSFWDWSEEKMENFWGWEVGGGCFVGFSSTASHYFEYYIL